MSRVLQPALAGTWYPGRADALRKSVQGYLDDARVHTPPPKAIIAPHAGHVYSGPVAGSAYAAVRPARRVIRRVVLAGPSHRVYFEGLAAPSFDSVASPLGEIPVDRAALDAIMPLPQVQVLDTPFLSGENSLEVHFPFLQVALDDFTLLPLAVGQATPEQVADVFRVLWGGPETLLVVSSDLTHFLEYDEARGVDTATSDAIEHLQADSINDGHLACGHIPVAGLLQAAKEHGLKAKTIDLRSSGDTAGPRDQVVGYGAYVFN
ncbi:MAG: AmmeMemoRadiSam system protein B [Kiritimatiellae bacterium]|nr:AmmeMemoRadiSam system protein B [Kiritimatiellia bacterium]